jgi:hypothetical protein
MPTTAILGFVFGVFTTVLLGGGLLFTLWAMHRVGEEAETNQRKPSDDRRRN